MQNLAGSKDCDRVIQRELTVARITIVKGDLSTGEVPATITGVLGKFTFYRAWYYWVAKGLMPLKNAKELYADPAGRTDVRVAGHCGCPPPQEWATWRDDEGNTLLPMKEKAGFDDFVAKGHISSERMTQKRFVENPQEGHGFIDTYHIDSEVGLRLFADMIRKIDASIELSITVPG